MNVPDYIPALAGDRIALWSGVVPVDNAVMALPLAALGLVLGATLAGYALIHIKDWRSA